MITQRRAQATRYPARLTPVVGADGLGSLAPEQLVLERGDDKGDALGVAVDLRLECTLLGCLARMA